MTANQRIKELRMTLKMKQIDFAAAIFVSNTYLADLENERQQVNDRILRLIALTFGVSEKWLKTGEGPMFHRTTEQKAERINALFNMLSPRFQDCALKQLDLLIELQNSGETPPA